jgi:hypothetical protein
MLLSERKEGHARHSEGGHLTHSMFAHQGCSSTDMWQPLPDQRSHRQPNQNANRPCSKHPLPTRPEERESFTVRFCDAGQLMGEALICRDVAFLETEGLFGRPGSHVWTAA